MFSDTTVHSLNLEYILFIGIQDKHRKRSNTAILVGLKEQVSESQYMLFMTDSGLKTLLGKFNAILP